MAEARSSRTLQSAFEKSKRFLESSRTACKLNKFTNNQGDHTTNRRTQNGDVCSEQTDVSELCTREMGISDECNRKMRIGDVCNRNIGIGDVCNREMGIRDVCNNSISVKDVWHDDTLTTMDVSECGSRDRWRSPGSRRRGRRRSSSRSASGGASQTSSGGSSTTVSSSMFDPPDRDDVTFLSVVAPPGKRSDMCRIFKPFCKRVEGLSSVITVADQTDSSHHTLTSTVSVPHYRVTSGEINSPALAVMMFVPEVGQHSHQEIRHKFQKLPWRHHHTIQLQRSNSLCVVGKQEFYFLTRQLPLWSVCAHVQDSCKIRFNFFVRRFSAMVEFYRLITGTEMESSKHDFCLFPLNSSPDSEHSGMSSIPSELALKHCPNVNPYPINDAYLTFPVQNMTSLRQLLHSDVTSAGRDRYVTHDPDGNTIVLHDVTGHHHPNDVTNTKNAYVTTHFSQKLKEPGDKSSIHSGSIDSGRFSDFDVRSSELEHFMSRVVQQTSAQCPLREVGLCDSAHCSGSDDALVNMSGRHGNTSHHHRQGRQLCSRSAIVKQRHDGRGKYSSNYATDIEDNFEKLWMHEGNFS